MRLIRHSKSLNLPDDNRRASRVYEDALYSKIWELLSLRGVRKIDTPKYKEIDRKLLGALDNWLRVHKDASKAIRVYTEAKAKRCEHATMLLWRYLRRRTSPWLEQNQDFANSVVVLMVRRGLKMRQLNFSSERSGAACFIQIRWRLYKRTRAAKKIQRQFRLWSWRKHCLWNPHTEIGRNNLLIKSRAATHLT